eukprot:TRINITY_DN1026_c0_g1_i3.p1 TRINITY_DN1026_c0_g1~~TRINITY_DN1026_c0_g1_i3.p1  ORF type:complete len:276 (-),score=59.82 TRINITY_DN1026_c0_g1_i3:93-920(-)
MVAAKMLFLLMPVALALEQELALVQLQAEKLLNDGSGMTDGSEENPIDVLSHAKDAMKAAVQRALGHDTTKEHTVVKTTVNASKKHAVASKPNASQKHVVAPKANTSQEHRRPKAMHAQQHAANLAARADRRARRKVRHARRVKHAANLAARKAARRGGTSNNQTQKTMQVVSFHLNDANTEFGDRIVIVGDDEQFGNWEPTNGMDLHTDNHTFPEWKLENVSVVYPSNVVEYKFVVLKTTGDVEWEQFGVEANRKLSMSMDAIQVVDAVFGVLA